MLNMLEGPRIARAPTIIMKTNGIKRTNFLFLLMKCFTTTPNNMKSNRIRIHLAKEEEIASFLKNIWEYRSIIWLNLSCNCDICMGVALLTDLIPITFNKSMFDKKYANTDAIKSVTWVPTFFRVEYMSISFSQTKIN